MVEQAGDRTWNAAVIGEHTVLGTGISKEAALEDLRNGIKGLLEHLKSAGLPPTPIMEIVRVELPDATT